MEEKNDAELVALARLGDKDAFGTLAQRHEAAARRVALTLASEADLASELVQEATVQAYLSLDHLRDPSRFKGWLCSILRNVHRSHLRDRRQVQDLDGIQEGLRDSLSRYDAMSPEASAEKDDLRNAVVEALARLPSVDQKALSLFYFDDVSMAEIGQSLGVSEGAAKVRLHRARKKLKAAMEKHSPEIIPHIGRETMVEVRILDVIKEERADAEGKPYTMYVIVLADSKGKRALPVWVGAVEGQSIVQGIAGYSMPRPMTLDLTAKLLDAAGVSVEHVRVESLKEDTYYGVIRLLGKEGATEVDARPSDAMALAVRLHCPMFVSDELFRQASLAIPTDTSKEGVGIRNVIKELDGLKHRWTTMSKVDKQQIKKSRQELLAELLKQH